MSNIYAKIVDSMQKVFPSEEPCGEERGKTVLQNERVNFQLVYKNDSGDAIALAKIDVLGTLAPYVTIRSAELVPAQYFPQFPDTYTYSAQPGLYPDPLKPFGATGAVLPAWQWKAFYVSIEKPDGFEAGVSALRFILRTREGKELSRLSYRLEVLPVSAAESDLKITNWMHYDGIEAKHGVKLFDDGFYGVFEGYLREYVRAGNNMLLTPLFTPPLDTEIGGERRTAQLIGVTVAADGGYEFDFDELKRFGEFAFAHGIKYLEFSHLFTQWGGKCCPKIMAKTESGEEKKIFGWETASDSKEYLAFLDAFLPQLTGFVRKQGWAKKCYFHLTDEPGAEHLEKYTFLRDFVKARIGDFPVMDAISHYEFYEKGGIDVPVPITSSYAAFENKGIKELFVYYCCGPARDFYSNRFLNMPLQRTKIIGAQLYETGVQGFLHWGFNFYNTARSYAEINPYEDTSAGAMFPSGDSFVVYPGRGDAVGSLRSETLGEAFFEYRVLKTLESYIGRKKTLKILHDFGVRGYTEYPKNSAAHRKMREKIYAALKRALKTADSF